ncbi:hypothetical protein HN873_066793, partial [Arachis hypogaea]
TLPWLLYSRLPAVRRCLFVGVFHFFLFCSILISECLINDLISECEIIDFVVLLKLLLKIDLLCYCICFLISDSAVFEFLLIDLLISGFRVIICCCSIRESYFSFWLV